MIAAVPCGECEYCQRGWQTVCPTQKAVGYHWDGGLARYIIIPEEVLKVDGLNPIEDHVSFAEASVAEPFACALNAQELANVGEGDVVAVVGAGPIGCIHVRLARARGAREVYLIELLPRAPRPVRRAGEAGCGHLHGRGRSGGRGRIASPRGGVST